METAPGANQGIMARINREVTRNLLRTRNGIKMATGVSRPDLGQSPKDVIWKRGRTELWHYHSDKVTKSPPVLIVFSLVSRSYILDLQPGNSFILHLLNAGFDVYLLDWGIPDERDASNTLEDYVDDYIPAGIAQVLHDSGCDQVNLLGYCLGGVLALLYAAHHLDAPLGSLTVMTTPADFHEMGPMADAVRIGGLKVETVLDENGNVPPEIVRQGFRVVAPTADVTTYVNLWEKLWNDDYITAHQAMTGWGNDHIPLSGGVARQMMQMIEDNSFINDNLVVGGDRVSLSKLTVPFMTVLAKRDHIVPQVCAGPLLDLVGSPDKQELRLDSGHIGLVVGRTAAKTTIPTIIDFLDKRSETTA